MRHFDVFNGDADGLCALRQLRLDAPAAGVLVTGVKRDLALLGRVRAAAGDLVTVLDLPFEHNRAAVVRLLSAGAQVRYFDHHEAGTLPQAGGFEAHVDARSGLCTAMLVDRLLGGRFRSWAVAAAFGEGLQQAALDLGASIPLGTHALAQLRGLGENLNYNAHGETEADVVVPPAVLYQALAGYEDPLRFVIDDPLYGLLESSRHADLAAVVEAQPAWKSATSAVYLLPDAAGSRRVSATFADDLARWHERRAHAVLTPRAEGGYLVSVRAPAGARAGAGAFCRVFGGGGRREAGGIDRLPAAELDAFVQRFAAAFG